MTDAEQEEPTRYAVRFSTRANRDAENAVRHLGQATGDQQIAGAWYTGLKSAVGTLATLPRRYGLAPEREQFSYEVRQFLYRRTPDSVAYRVLFVVQDETPDGARVTLIHIRHGAARPLRRADARAIEAQNRAEDGPP